MHGVGTNEVSVSDTGICTRRRKLVECLAVEQRKLEAMVIDLFNKGNRNLGTDQMVLEQSRKLDQLVVDKMILEELINRMK